MRRAGNHSPNSPSPIAHLLAAFERDHVCLGRFDRPYAVRGWIKFTPYYSNPAGIIDFAQVALSPAASGGDEGDEQLPAAVNFVQIEAARPSGKYWIAKVVGYDSPEAAAQLRGRLFGVSPQLLPTRGEGEWYVRELVGLEARDEAGKNIGIIAAVHNYGAGDILVIHNQRGKHVVNLPFSQQFVPRVEPSAGYVQVALYDLV